MSIGVFAHSGCSRIATKSRRSPYPRTGAIAAAAGTVNACESAGGGERPLFLAAHASDHPQHALQLKRNGNDKI
jgi:hypothetical protein